MQRSFVTLTASTSAFSNQNGPIIPRFQMVTLAMYFTEFKDNLR